MKAYSIHDYKYVHLVHKVIYYSMLDLGLWV